MSGSQTQTRSYLRTKFKEYYTARSEEIDTPTGLDQREFGFLLFDENTMFRHLGFRSSENVWDYLRVNAPAHAYYSSAYYKEPEAEMEEKGWQGADLVFDIDADHLKTPCKEKHDKWICRNCGNEGRGTPPGVCSKCGKPSFEEETWFCTTCLETARFETLKLVDILTQDLGISITRELSINFSGNRGYHVHVYNDDIRHIDQLARREIVDYVRGTGIEPRFHSLDSKTQNDSSFPWVGWTGRLARALYSLLLDSDTAELANLGFNEKTVKDLVKRKEEMQEHLRDGPSGKIFDLMSLADQKVIERLVQEAVGLESAAIDTVVTADIHRLIRLPKSLHGKTGLKAEKVPVGALEDFDPLNRAVAFDRGEITVHVTEAPEFRIGNNTYGPIKKQTVELPSAAAMLLLCKGVASVVK